MLARMYLRASTDEQDAERARATLEQFATDHGLRIAASYVENESGAKLVRPELFRLLRDCAPGDILLLEQVDRLSRLNEADWRRLRAEIETRQVRVVAMDLPTSWMFATASTADEFTGRLLGAVNGMLLDMLAAMARKDWADRRRRQAEGIAVRRQAEGEKAYPGRPEDTQRNRVIAKMLAAGATYAEVTAATGAARATIAKIAKRRHAKEMV